MSEPELFDVAAEITAETEKAWQLYDGKVKKWVPKSLVENNRDGTFTMPVWLARREEFI